MMFSIFAIILAVSREISNLCDFVCPREKKFKHCIPVHGRLRLFSPKLTRLHQFCKYSMSKCLDYVIDSSIDFKQFKNSDQVSHKIEVFFVSEAGIISNASKERHLIVYFAVSYLCQDGYSDQQFNGFMQSLKGIGTANTNSHIAMKQVCVSVVAVSCLRWYCADYF